MPREQIVAPVWLARSVLGASGLPVTAPNLVFNLNRLDSSQLRFRGRFVSEPDVDLSKYTMRACVDWVTLHVRLIRASQCMHISRALKDVLGRHPHVTDLKERTGAAAGTGVDFLIRVQDPTYSTLIATERTLNTLWGTSRRIQMMGMEVAIDVYPNDKEDASRWLMTALLAKTILPAPELLGEGLVRGRYIHDHKLSPEFLVRASRHAPARFEVSMPDKSHPIIHAAPPADGTVYFGAEKGSVMLRVQDKIGDNRNPGKDSLVVLPQSEKRARIEVRLDAVKLKALKLNIMHDLPHFNFEALRVSIFTFWLPTFSIHDDERDQGLEIFKHSGIYGLERHEIAMQKRERDGKPKPWGSTRDRLAYEQLNERMRRALRSLSQKWRSTSSKAA